MIKIKELNKSNYKEALALWNSEAGFIYPITEEIFVARVFDCRDISNSYVAYIEDALVGFIVSKKDIVSLVGWISLLYVSKKFRKQGIATRLLDLVEKEMSVSNLTKIKVGSDFDNFFPGIPCDFSNAAIPWFTKKGYNMIRYTFDVTASVDRVKTYAIEDKKITFRFAKLEEKEKVLSLLRDSFSERWYQEGLDAIAHGDFESSYVIALNKEEVVAFLRCNQLSLNKKPYNITWHERFEKLAGVGPLGVKNNYRKHGLGKDIISWALNHLKEKGVSDVLIDWTGLLEFYQQFGFEVWKSYMYSEKVFN